MRSNEAGLASKESAAWPLRTWESGSSENAGRLGSRYKKRIGSRRRRWSRRLQFCLWVSASCGWRVLGTNGPGKLRPEKFAGRCRIVFGTKRGICVSTIRGSPQTLLCRGGEPFWCAIFPLLAWENVQAGRTELSDQCLQDRIDAQYLQLCKEMARRTASLCRKEDLHTIFLVGSERLTKPIETALPKTFIPRVAFITKDLGNFSVLQLQQRLEPSIAEWTAKQVVLKPGLPSR